MRQLLCILILAVGLLSFKSYAAGPIMHVALGEKWLAIFAPDYSEEERKLFLLGTVFPDIRYLGVIERDQSHFKGITLDKVLQVKSPFQRGVLFHSFVDEFRDKLVRKWAIEKNIVDVSLAKRGTFLKLVEDQITHGQHDWSQFRVFLAKIPEEEMRFGIEMQALTQWHTGLTVYFTTVPSFILTQISMFEQGILNLDASTVKLWSTLLPKYAEDPMMIKYVEKLNFAFEQVLTTHVKYT